MGSFEGIPPEKKQAYAEAWARAGYPGGPGGLGKWAQTQEIDAALGTGTGTGPRQTMADATAFGQQGAAGYGGMTGQLQGDRQYLQELRSGQNSLSSEQLRQGLQQQQAQQMSMAAGARPGSQPMAARSAMMNMSRQGSAMSGQAAMAGIQERNMAAQQLASLNLGQRQQDLQATMGSQQTAGTIGLGISQQELDKYKADREYSTQERNSYMGMVGGGLGMMAMSDRRLKTDIKDASSGAEKLLKGLRPYAYRYKDEKHGKGEQLGIMAQDLERAGLKSAVIDTPAGKAVHGARLATALAAALPGLDQRLAKLEKGK